MSGIRLAVQQEITITAHGHSFRDVITLIDKHEAGVHARTAEVQHKYLEVNLAHITYAAPQSRKKKGAIKNFSAEDIFQMSMIQPATHGTHIHNEYFLRVYCSYEGCTCCASLPHASIPLNIVPIVNPACYGF